MGDWRTYDDIADCYDRLWSSRFGTVARALRALIPSPQRGNLLDIGTGTGLVPLPFQEADPQPAFLVGCDRSLPMLEQARKLAPGLRVIIADATALPFPDRTFDVATASFVLSHVHEYRRAVLEAFRVLMPGGLFAVSNWAPAADRYSSAWRELLEAAVSPAAVERAVAEMIPWEDYLSRPGHLEEALTEAGFSVVESQTIRLELALTVEQFLEDRELTSTGRHARHLLGGRRWAQVRTAAVDHFHDRFGPIIHYERQAILVVGKRP